MTDVSATGLGSVAAQPQAAADAGNPAGGNGGGSNGSGTAPGSTSAGPQATADNLDWAKAKGWVKDGALDVEQLSKGYQSLEKAFSTSVRMPDEKASPEEWDSFHKKLGWPGDAQKYDFKRPDNLPENLPYNEALAGQFKAWANEAKLPVQTAAAMHDKFMKFQADAFAADVKAFAEQVTQKAQAAHKDFVREWGDPSSDAYRQNVEAARRAVQNDPKLANVVNVMKQAGLIAPDGSFTDFGVGHMFAQLGKARMNDSFVAANGSSGVEKNPFPRTLADGRTNPHFDMTAANSLIRQNPDEARRLLTKAGMSPQEWGL